ncbi:hypothetical protein M409DRAFT_30031 [Zasmidium cellare ATCC 36951]|uniref:Uncharacterized protein n=1 Tax=Zasmidium cellare ATCC 36951 TaxID=1080233 RepID=A0A6A6C1G7_ZASCE|nr:uncharacterized protein M409DRAFT_30031 [Zasmidium cellare ATCC 36951]KAF2159556.1 hypothetical protein M409DRAFT_30031 [Zasmidium cellare ATCC 36951]
MPTKLPATIPDGEQQQILSALVTAAFILHSGQPVLDFTRALFEAAVVDEAVEERWVDEKEVGMNGGFGEAQACKALARAYALLIKQDEKNNADELKGIALSRFTGDTWEENVRAVESGW